MTSASVQVCSVTVGVIVCVFSRGAAIKEKFELRWALKMLADTELLPSNLKVRARLTATGACCALSGRVPYILLLNVVKIHLCFFSCRPYSCCIVVHCFCGPSLS